MPTSRKPCGRRTSPATTPRSRRSSTTSHRDTGILPVQRTVRLALLFLFIASATTRADEFVTSYWYGPPPEQTTFERYKEIKDANFNVVFPPAIGGVTPEVNHRILDYCQKLGMKAVIHDSRM